MRFVILLFSLMLFTWLAVPAYAQTPISSCQTLNTPGEYVLQTDVSSPSTCFDVTANDVTLDLGGHTITYATEPIDQISNGDFELGAGSSATDWDFSGATGAQRFAGAYYDNTLWSGSYSISVDTAPGELDIIRSTDIITLQPDVNYLVSGHFYNTVSRDLEIYFEVRNASNDQLIESTSCARSGSTRSTRGFQFCPWHNPHNYYFNVNQPTNAYVQIRINNPTNSSGTVYFDYVRLILAEYMGVVASPGLKLKNGQINLSNQACIKCHNIEGPTYAEIHNLTNFAGGVEGSAIYGIYNGGGCHHSEFYNNTFIHHNFFGKSPEDIVIFRDEMYGIIRCAYSGGNTSIYNNIIRGSPQVGIQFSGSPSLDYGMTYFYGNDFAGETKYTQGFAILAGGTSKYGYESYNNFINMSSGRGIGGHRNGSIYNNTIYVREHRNQDYANVDMLAFGIQVEQARNITIYDNYVESRTHDDRGDAIGLRFSNDAADITVYNNTFIAIYEHAGQTADALSVLAADLIDNVRIFNNTFKSNNRIFAIEASNNTELESNTVEKLPSPYNFRTVYMHSTNYFSDYLFSLNTTFLDTKFANDLSFDEYEFTANGLPKEFEVRWFLDIEAREESMPASEATIQIFYSNNGSLVESGSTDLSGRYRTDLPEYMRTYPPDTKIDLSPYTVNVIYRGEIQTQPIVLDDSKTISFVFENQYENCSEAVDAGITGGRPCQEVDTCGSLGGTNQYYLLTQNISAAQSCLTFEGTNNVLDVNHHKITFGNSAGSNQYGIDFNVCSYCKLTNGFIEQGIGGGNAPFAIRSGGNLISNSEISYLTISYYGEDGSGMMDSFNDLMNVENTSIHDNYFNMAVTSITNRMDTHAAIGLDILNGRGAKVYNNILRGTGHTGISINPQGGAASYEPTEVYNNDIDYKGYAANSIALACGGESTNIDLRPRYAFVHDNYVNMSGGKGIYTGGSNAGRYGLTDSYVYNNYIETVDDFFVAGESQQNFAVRIRYGAYNLTYTNNTFVSKRIKDDDFCPRTVSIAEGPPHGGEIKFINNTIISMDHASSPIYNCYPAALWLTGPQGEYSPYFSGIYFEENRIIGDDNIFEMPGYDGYLNGTLWVNNTFERGSRSIPGSNVLHIGFGGLPWGYGENHTFIDSNFGPDLSWDNINYDNGNYEGGTYFFKWTTNIEVLAQGTPAAGALVTIMDNKSRSIVTDQAVDTQGLFSIPLTEFEHTSSSYPPPKEYIMNNITVTYGGETKYQEVIVNNISTITFNFDNVTCYDTNGDLKVNIIDLVLVIFNQGKNNGQGDWQHYDHLDVNQDGLSNGVIDFSDVLAILNQIGQIC